MSGGRRVVVVLGPSVGGIGVELEIPTPCNSNIFKDYEKARQVRISIGFLPLVVRFGL